MKIVVIGVGRMGRRHILAATGLGFQVVGIHDPRPESIALAIQERGISPEKCFSNVGEMLRTTSPDGMVIASTAPSHCHWVCEAADHGVKYILCEKPMAVSLAECDRMINACRKSGSHLAINHQMRFMEQYARIKTLGESPEFGGVRSVTIAGANFGLAMNGCHYFEMIRYMTGSRIDWVSFNRDHEIVPNPRGTEFEDYSGQLQAVTRGGHRLYLEIGGDLGHGIQAVYGCRYGQIIVDELAGLVRTICRKEEFRALPTTRYGMPADEQIFKIEPADVIEPTKRVWKSLIEGIDYPDAGCGRSVMLGLVAATISGENSGVKTVLGSNLPSERVFSWA